MKVVYFLFVLCSPILTDSAFLLWAHYAERQNQTACWTGAIVPMSSTSESPWYVSPLQGTDWHSLYTYILDMMHNPNTCIYRDNSVTRKKKCFFLAHDQ